MKELTASFSVKNTGRREGATVAQLYMTSNPAGPQQRLAGFKRVELKPGASQTVTVNIDPRIVAEYVANGWEITRGAYGFALGDDAEKLSAPVAVTLRGRKIKP